MGVSPADPLAAAPPFPSPVTNDPALVQFSVDQSSLATFWIDRNGRIVHVNQAACRALGYSEAELLQRRVHDLDPHYPPEEWENYWRELKACGARTFVSSLRHRDGRMVPVEVTVKCLEYAGHELQFAYVQDISQRLRAEADRRRLEERLLHGQKLESLGVMAGGIAHDFNNLLTVILGNALLAQGQVESESTVAHHLGEVVKASRSAAELCQQLLAFTGRCNSLPVAVGLDEIVRRLSTPPRPESGSIQFHQFLAEPSPIIHADAAQVAQALNHLRTNAIESLPPEGGDVTLTTGVLRADRKYLDQTWLGAGLPEGPCAFVEVRDTGHGMDEATRARMFEPFFSTKFVGRGLGLAFVFGIMRAHRGAIAVSTTPGHGTSVRLLFPIAETDGPTGTLASQPAATPAVKGTILVVEDEPAIRELVREVLQHEGYRGLFAADGMEALHLYKSHWRAIDVVVLDLTMPRLGGEATFHQLRAVQPAARIILCTGYDAHQAVNRLLVQDVAGILQKPYSPAQLLDLLDNVLRASRLRS